MPDPHPSQSNTGGDGMAASAEKLRVSDDPLAMENGIVEEPDAPFGWITIGWIGFLGIMSRVEPLVFVGIPAMALASFFAIRSRSRTGEKHGYTMLGIVGFMIAFSLRDWLDRALFLPAGGW